MPDSSIPWVGLAALAAMFVLPLLPNWLFEGPRDQQALATAAHLRRLWRPLDRRPHLPPWDARARAAAAGRTAPPRPTGRAGAPSQALDLSVDADGVAGRPVSRLRGACGESRPACRMAQQRCAVGHCLVAARGGVLHSGADW
jgi:hypothetical protein